MPRVSPHPPANHADRLVGTAAAAVIVLACVLLWSLLPAVLLSAPHGDNVEQLNWSHAVQWCYFKHPPLPTWLLCAAIEVFGRSAALTYALAMSCVGIALVMLWRCARQVLDPPAALAALLFSSANYYLMGRGSFLNHNTVMLPFVALSAWAVLRIVRGAGWQAWLLLGLAQALGMLTKYQMALVIGANGLALLAASVHRQPRFAGHAALASGATLLPLMPHLAWLADHQFSSFEYAGHSLLAGLGIAQRAAATAGFLAQQVGRLAPAAAAGALALAIDALRRHRAATPASPAAPPQTDSRAGRALAVLALAPLAGIVLLSLGLGVAPQNHWGSSTTLLLPLWITCRARHRLRWSAAAAATATVAVHLGAAAWNVVAWAYHPGPHHVFAARPLAALAQAHWAAHHAGTIPLLLGPDWEAGALSLYLPGQPPVVPAGDWRQAPWVDPDRARACGYLVIGRTGAALEQQVAGIAAADRADPITLSWRDARGRDSSIQVAAVAPLAPLAALSGSHCR
jgi:4-amino-4-deoxy-L-arabinose transferase-like glycosyltransferase